MHCVSLIIQNSYKGETERIEGHSTMHSWHRWTKIFFSDRGKDWAMEGKRKRHKSVASGNEKGLCLQIETENIWRTMVKVT
jgi:hypothetical protein